MKTQVCLNLDQDTAFILRELADKNFSGNISAAANWFFRSKKDEIFYRFMAKHYQLLATAYRDKVTIIEEERDQKPVTHEIQEWI